ncbi:hypothetical protein DFJ67_2189 [Asanoa ferruginea]|uniref:DUF5666 domain-containing protein n=1 Tax=Asanoa ferruginea TaxID=53367 RepID=A0A3D9ZIB8_9ACTN|nr:hypothetical protein [Asanoa ferruginea]REF96212.1 hypothetical protein DFJ67_2189 [Asanoa ferruginea]GIF49366.1 hypothetical protein Afe04nite_39050 [Asanoa ferruginea]
MRRWLAGIGLVAVVGLGLTGCGLASSGGQVADQAYDVVAGMGAEGEALAAMGFDPDDITPAELAELKLNAPSPSPSATVGPKGKGHNGDRGKRLKARVLLRKNTLHGEAVVQTKDGTTQTVLVQRGQVTAVDSDSITVKSTDGFSLTWSFADDLRVVERRNSIEAKQLAVGAQVGVAGTKSGDGGSARLIVIPRDK